MSEVLQRKLDQLIKAPETAELLVEIGICLLELEDWENSELYFERAYRLNAYYHPLILHYGEVLCRLGKTARALQLYENYLAQAESREIREKLGDCHYQLGQYKAAEEIYTTLGQP